MNALVQTAASRTFIAYRNGDECAKAQRAPVASVFCCRRRSARGGGARSEGSVADGGTIGSVQQRCRDRNRTAGHLAQVPLVRWCDCMVARPGHHQGDVPLSSLGNHGLYRLCRVRGTVDMGLGTISNVF